MSFKIQRYVIVALTYNNLCVNDSDKYKHHPGKSWITVEFCVSLLVADISWKQTNKKYYPDHTLIVR